MDFAYSDIQRQFRATLRRFAEEHGAEPAWSALAELGTLAALLPEAYEGMGGDSVDALAILEEFGRHSIATPIVETVILAGGLIARLGSEAQKQRWLPGIAAGRLQAAVAGENEEFAAAPVAEGFRLDGRQSVVVAPENLDLLLIAAGSDGAADLSLFAVEPDRPGLRIQRFQTIDDRSAATVEAGGVALVEADRVGPGGGAQGAIAECLDLATVAQCAEAVGIMAALLEQTIRHLNTRTQFGQTLGGFQALRHRLAEMYLAYELALSATYKAAILAREPASVECRRAVSAAKVEVSEAARRVGHEAIQMHGAIGMSLELPVGRAVKRLKAMAPQYGSSRAHLRRYHKLGHGKDRGSAA